MDELDRHLEQNEVLEDDDDSSDTSSRRGGKKLKLPLVKPMCVGEIHSIYCTFIFLSCLLLTYELITNLLVYMSRSHLHEHPYYVLHM